MSTAGTYRAACFCGSVAFEVSGEPVAMGYCHCDSCRHWSASPVNAFSLWRPDAIRITRGESDIAAYQKTPKSVRKWCSRCGGHLFAEHPHWALTDVYAALLPDLPFRPGVHVNYQEAVLQIHDGIQKLRDLPKEMGGTGEPIA